MSPAQHLLPHIHELRDRVTSISNEFLQLGGDESNSLSTVENKASSKTTLSKSAQSREDEFVLSGGQSACNVVRGRNEGLAVSLGRRCMFWRW